MLIKVAWRNIWRSRVRSLVVIVAIALGLWAGIFASAFVNGMMRQKVDSVIKKEVSHFQFHHKEFRDELDIQFMIEHPGEVMSRLSQDVGVEALSGRVISHGTMVSARANNQLKINGIIAPEEAAVTALNTYITEGDYLDHGKRSRSIPILVGEALAKEHKLKIRSKILLRVMDLDNEIKTGGFKVVGFFNTQNNMYDKANVFVRQEDLNSLIGMEGALHEIAVLLKDHEQVDLITEKYQQMYPDLEVLSWKDLVSGMRYMVEAMGVYTVALVGIILVALLFSIINTMLMAILERVRELGMLMAVGMNKKRVFLMVLLETLFLSLLGGPLGFLVSYLSILLFGEHGINLSGAAYEDFGFASIIYPYLEFTEYVKVMVMVLSMAMLAAIYPARKALKLNPAEAIRKI